MLLLQGMEGSAEVRKPLLRVGLSVGIGVGSPAMNSCRTERVKESPVPMNNGDKALLSPASSTLYNE